MTTHEAEQIREAVQQRYADAARNVSSCCGSSCGPTALSDTDPFGSSQYDQDHLAGLPDDAVAASLGCGNPTALAELKPGDVVLDLGSGGGIDVLLSARRVSPGGKAYGLDMTPDMLELADANKAKAGVDNVEFLLGSIEDVPLPDDSVDVIISNCVVNLSADKDQVFAEAIRVLRPGGRFAISDIVLSRPLPSGLATVMSLWTGCIAGALTQDDCAERMTVAGFEGVSIEPTTIFGRPELEGLAAGLDPVELSAGLDLDAAIAELDGVIRSAFIRGTKPGASTRADDTPEATTANGVTERVPSIHVREPALCCNTGVCGPDLDPAVVAFTADLAHLIDQGANITRQNLANDPTAFTSSDTVRSFLRVAGGQSVGAAVAAGSARIPESMQDLPGMDVYDVVVRLPKTLSPATSVAQALTAFEDEHVHMLLITGEDGRLLGTLVRNDLEQCVANAAPALDRAVLRDRTVAPDFPAEQALRILRARGERRLAVIDQGGRLVGLLCLKRRLNGFCSDSDVRERATDITRASTTHS